MKLCRKCGFKDFDDDAVFCRECGSKLVSPSSEIENPSENNNKEKKETTNIKDGIISKDFFYNKFNNLNKDILFNAKNNQLNNIRLSCNIPDEEEIFAIIDGTVFHSAKDGVAFTSKGIYGKEQFKNPIFLPWKYFNQPNVSIEIGLMSVNIFCQGIKFHFDTSGASISCFNLQKVFLAMRDELLNELNIRSPNNKNNNQPNDVNTNKNKKSSSTLEKMEELIQESSLFRMFKAFSKECPLSDFWYLKKTRSRKIPYDVAENYALQLFLSLIFEGPRLANKQGDEKLCFTLASPKCLFILGICINSLCEADVNSQFHTMNQRDLLSPIAAEIYGSKNMAYSMANVVMHYAGYEGEGELLENVNPILLNKVIREILIQENPCLENSNLEDFLNEYIKYSQKFIRENFRVLKSIEKEYTEEEIAKELQKIKQARY